MASTNVMYSSTSVFYTITVNASVASQTNTTATINWSANIKFGNYYLWGVGLRVYVDGVQVGSTTGACTAKQQTICSISGTKTVNKTNAARTVSFSASSYSTIVNGYDGVGKVGTASGSLSISAGSFTSIPAPPTGVTATRNSDTSIVIKWTNHPTTGGIANNLLQVSTDDGAWTNVSTSIGGSTTSYTWGSGAANHKYKFRVASKNSAGTSDYTESNDIYTTPAAPSGGFGVAFGNSKGATAIVTNIKYADTFDWQRSSDNSSWTTLGNYDSASISETTTIAQPYYRCRAVAPNGVAGSYSSGFRVSKAVRVWINSSSNPKKIFINSSSGRIKNVYYKT